VSVETKTQDSYHHGDLANALLVAVGEIVDEKGAAAVSLREAARRAGVSHAAPAHHFGDKDGMIVAFCHQGFEILSRQMADAIAGAADVPPEERIALLGATYVRFADEHRAHFDMMFRTGLDVVDDASHHELEENGGMDLLRGTVAELVEAGKLAPGDAEAFAVALWSQAHGLASLWVDGAIPKMFPDMPLEDILDKAFGESRLGFVAASL
jgi:AcrR family transcriptional regulator